ncbi:Isopenicillin N synthase [Tistlia consotensis]|uniref:Isopenicillin N synthase n=1 Tax=Tistlia consotensis USBA 355 TaxID=560819 RepID=A0A1Y6BM89_9PROT|nr:2-oxoglutarate and iron-dependent oxygenase domain-containing protein [Tistlia consotensis]SMF19310.1 Isopenicillin N synthase [Tistlia consotensis USBA 355]SNR39057.1 Isopenicillin N synthase [Tistlia consotensis]
MSVESSVNDTLDPALVGARVPVEAVPVIDFGRFLAGGPEDRRETARQIGEACRNIGFFYLVNHGIPQETLDAVFAEAKRFFALPPERKAEIAIEKSACHRGYFALGGENLDPAKQKEAGDFKEGIKIGRDLPPDHPLVEAGTPLHGPNQWPAGLPGWQETMQAGYDRLCGLGREIMHAFALALELPEDHFDRWLDGPMATLGPLHYPPQTGPITEARIGAGAHTDFGCLTILAQDPVGGLQVRNAAGEWIDAPFVEGSFVVNIGDMMERWTNGIFSSTQHRVINRSGRDRYSLPFFYDPAFEADLTVLETCQGPDRPARFPPTTGGRHLLDKINETFDYHREKQKAG